ncbi:PDDEXK nuclease domain-containing protein [Bacteroides cellulosilyticus]|jgi:predicted nuclease of restriction endonuclease-like (RecB) superfamily|uniref:PDDEXK nuclease domain-containing protein n=1 Tax=Bacteroides cellulosilyticus TaxID=246787 RepID=UPI0018AD0DCF|nr:PDDEXK nuclease domain-containing protein [Bacteroides cellulosilyticus]
MNFEQLATIITDTHQQLQQSAVKAVNQHLTVRNWLIGFYIVEFEQNGEDRAAYGEQLLKNLEQRINQKALSITLFQWSRKFYLSYPQFNLLIIHSFMLICETPSHKLVGNGEKLIYETLSHKLQNSGNKEDKKSIPAEKLLSSISFSHFIELMKIDNPIKRMYYEMLTIQTGLSVRELKRQIGALSYERVGLSGDIEHALTTIQQKIHPQTVTDTIKDDYFFEFLNIPQQRASLLKENELETLLLDHLRDFIIELGNGFCFEARQKRILIGDEYYFIDMVFYHRILKAHILLEVKISPFDHAHVSQLYSYLNYYKAEVMEPDDNPPIGILLVTDKNDALVQYATAGMDEQIFVSKYKLQLPTEQQLKDLILKTIRQ